MAQKKLTQIVYAKTGSNGPPKTPPPPPPGATKPRTAINGQQKCPIPSGKSSASKNISPGAVHSREKILYKKVMKKGCTAEAKEHISKNRRFSQNHTTNKKVRVMYKNGRKSKHRFGW